MIRTGLALFVVALMSSAGLAQSQTETPKPPTTTAPKGEAPAKGKDQSKAGEKNQDKTKVTAKYPEKVKKDLHAKTDYRGKKAPVFKVEKWLTKEPEHKGKVMLIDFWATWCGPCRRLIPELEGFQEKFKDDLVVIGVSDEKEDVVKKFVAAQAGGKVGYSMAVDTHKAMKNAVGVNGIPHVLIVDSKGMVRWQGFPGEASEPLTEKIVKQIIDADKAERGEGKAEEKPKTEPKKDAEPAKEPKPKK